MTTSDELDEVGARAYQGLDDLWIEDRAEAWIAPKIAGWCDGRVLDLGIGTGVMGGMLYEAGVDLTVIEGSADLIDKASTLVPPGRMIHTMFEEFSVGSIKYDTVLCLFVLEHLERPDEILRRVRSWLKPSGLLVVAVPNATSVHRRVGELMTGQPADTPSERDLLVGHRRVYTLSTLRNAIHDAGFVVTGNAGWFLKPTANARMLDWPAEHIDALCQIGWEGRPEAAANLIVTAAVD